MMSLVLNLSFEHYLQERWKLPDFVRQEQVGLPFDLKAMQELWEFEK
jgi:hypothetical protein